MARTSLTIELMLPLLGEAPARIAAITAKLTPAQLRTRPEPEEWSANEVLAHLRSCSDVWGDAIRAIIADDALTIRAVNPRAWIAKTAYPELAFRTSCRAFAAQRRELVAFLEALPRPAWSHGATITGARKPLRRTVLDYAQRLTGHEQVHLGQLQAIAAAVRQG